MLAIFFIPPQRREILWKLNVYNIRNKEEQNKRGFSFGDRMNE
jgi:hypothetical protein